MTFFFYAKDLNDYLLNFSYGYSETKDKPGFTYSDDLADPFKNLGQTTAEMWLVSDEPLSDHCPEVWQVLLTLLELLVFVFVEK